MSNVVNMSSGNSSSQAMTLESIALHTDVGVSPNEPLVNHVLNRSAKKLLENDIELHKLYRAVFNQVNIVDYAHGMTYNAGDLVWHVFNGELYLLKCTVNNNSTTPNIQLDNGRPIESLLKLSGWEDKNRYLTILDYGIESYLQSLVDIKLDAHQDDPSMHPLGKVSLDKDDEHYIGHALLKKDMSNIDFAHTTTIFPQHVQKLNNGVAVMNGYMRNYGKVLEYDVIVKLASSSVLNDQHIFTSQTGLSANTLKLAMTAGLTQNSVSYQDNGKYFSTSESMDIFAPELADTYESRIGMSTQFNRNDYVNTYSAKITFPKPFADRDYMVFANSVLSQTNGTAGVSGNRCLVPSANDIAVCNKTRDSITLVDIVFCQQDEQQNGAKAQDGGLAANSFHCKVIGTIGV